jgi:hypothetical protein
MNVHSILSITTAKQTSSIENYKTRGWGVCPMAPLGLRVGYLDMLMHQKILEFPKTT